MIRLFRRPSPSPVALDRRAPAEHLATAHRLVALSYRDRYAPLVASLPPAPSLGPSDRVLVLAPHPDDDVLAGAGTLLEAERCGAQAWIVYLTSGDGFELDALLLERQVRTLAAECLALAGQRMDEARAGALALGVPPSNLYFLGYPDRGLGHLFLENYATPYRSPYTGEMAVPYEGTLSPGAPYTGEALERDLAKVLDEVRPTVVLASSPLDAHPDHHAVAGFAMRLLGGRGEAGKLRYWIVHGGLEWPLPKGLHPGLPLAPPPRGRGLPWARVGLGEDDRRRKLEAVRAHATQTALIGRFMLAFVRENELLSPTPLPEPATPQHADGTEQV